MKKYLYSFIFTVAVLTIIPTINTYADDVYYYDGETDEILEVECPEGGYHNLFFQYYEQVDSSTHLSYFKCRKCDQELIESCPHYMGSDGCWAIDDTYHTVNAQSCRQCGYSYYETEKHDYWSDTYVEATVFKKGTVNYICQDCKYKCTKSVTWGLKKDYCHVYYLNSGDVYKDSTKLKIELHDKIPGSTIRIQIGDKKYSKKVTDNSKNFAIPIKKSKYGSKIKIWIEYGGKRISDYFLDTVYYASKIKVGMTKDQVKYTWGEPDATSSSAKYTYWYYDDYSYVLFQNGKVKKWLDRDGYQR